MSDDNSTVKVTVYKFESHPCKPCDDAIAALEKIKASMPGLVVDIVKDDTQSEVPIIDIEGRCGKSRIIGYGGRDELEVAIRSAVCGHIREVVSLGGEEDES
jgi:hypothetical protein